MSHLLVGTALTVSLAVISAPAYAQQAGAVNGRVTNSDGSVLAGVTVRATSPVLPQSRTTASGSNGRYQLPLLPPGEYLLTFTKSDGSELKRAASVLLQQKIKVDVTFGIREEAIVITGSKTYIDTGRASLKNTLNTAIIEGVPIGQEYRDLQKLIPGVQYSEDTVRGPSAGGSGQDNSYQFDGVDVSLPLFGTLSAEPSTHDIDQVSIIRGGATARGFNRSGGFLINTISKRGTNEFHGELSYKVQTSGLTSGLNTGGSTVKFNQDEKWITGSLGGPIVKDKLFVYGSYYRPTVTRKNGNNALGAVPDFKSVRNEYFGKLTFAPTSNILLDASYRTSDRSTRNRGIGEFSSPTTSQGDDASLDIIIVEGSWVIDDKSSFSFKFTDFENKTASRPDTIFDLTINQGDSLNIGTLDQLGLFVVPQPISGAPAFNAFIQPIIDQYGFVDANGVRTGGGTVGGASTINNQDFSRTNFEASYDRTFSIGETLHDVHIGYQYQEIEEDLARLSNGYGVITAPGGRSLASDGITPIFFQARLSQLSVIGANGAGVVPQSINSMARLQSFEINDTIEKGDFTFNVGVLISQDSLFGQGLREKTGTISGFEVAPGNRYRMKKISWDDMIQPRFGANWDYSDTSSVYANYARYNPATSSLARAASWDRNLRRNIDIAFDINGDFIEIDPVRSSSGKVFQEGIKPRKIDEYLIGWNRQVSDELMVRTHVRYREGGNFWEDTNNTARLFANAPAEIQALGLYVPNLADIRAEIGGSSYVIAQLDNAHTDYYELGLEAEYNTDKVSITGSYTWSRYTGNFDQDNSTTSNDANTFVGSSFIADGIGRQLWDNRQGFLKGDRRHQFKLYGFYRLPWNAQFGAFSSYQSGQRWEAWDVEFFRAFTGSRSDTSRFAEAAGSRKTKAHLQVDLNYTQNLEVMSRYNLQFRADLFNAFNSQTGYNIQNKVNSAGFGDPRSFFRPRRLQLTVKASF